MRCELPQVVRCGSWSALNYCPKSLIDSIRAGLSSNFLAQTNQTRLNELTHQDTCGFKYFVLRFAILESGFTRKAVAEPWRAEYLHARRLT